MELVGSLKLVSLRRRGAWLCCWSESSEGKRGLCAAGAVVVVISFLVNVKFEGRKPEGGRGGFKDGGRNLLPIQVLEDGLDFFGVHGKQCVGP